MHYLLHVFLATYVFEQLRSGTLASNRMLDTEQFLFVIGLVHVRSFPSVR